MNSKKIGLIGYSGHSFVCIEIAQINKMNIIGYFEQNEKFFNPYNLTYLGNEDYASNKIDLFIGIGDNKIRQRVFNKLHLLNKSLNCTLIHPNSIISSSCNIGYSSILAAGVIVNALSNIDIGCIINSGSIIEHECHIKQFAHIAPGAVLAGNVIIGERSFIGANATIKQGVEIGNDVIIGAGSVILNNIPNNTIVVGNPGKILKSNI
jgi:sugar O-acyltransferase (sialic acid O-acetyltransferase NeuD family)